MVMTTDTATASPPFAYNRKNPFFATLTQHEHLTQPGSGKDTRHFVLSLAGGGPRYTPGDSLAVFAKNPPALVNEVIALLGLDADTPVKNPKGNGDTLPLRQVLNSCGETCLHGQERSRLRIWMVVLNVRRIRPLLTPLTPTPAVTALSVRPISV